MPFLSILYIWETWYSHECSIQGRFTPNFDEICNGQNFEMAIGVVEPTEHHLNHMVLYDFLGFFWGGVRLVCLFLAVYDSPVFILGEVWKTQFCFMETSGCSHFLDQMQCQRRQNWCSFIFFQTDTSWPMKTGATRRPQLNSPCCCTWKPSCALDSLMWWTMPSVISSFTSARTLQKTKVNEEVITRTMDDSSLQWHPRKYKPEPRLLLFFRIFLTISTKILNFCLHNWCKLHNSKNCTIEYISRKKIGIERGRLFQQLVYRWITLCRNMFYSEIVFYIFEVFLKRHLNLYCVAHLLNCTFEEQCTLSVFAGKDFKEPQTRPLVTK